MEAPPPRPSRPVLLVRPHIARKYSLNVTPPLGLGYIASALRSAGEEVFLLDLLKEGAGLPRLGEAVGKIRPGVAGFQYYSLNTAEVEEAAALCKSIDPGMIVVIGGPHPSAAPEQSLELVPSADYAISGEGEESFPLLCRALRDAAPPLREIPGLAWREGGTVLRNPPRFIADLDSLGLPAWDLMEPARYPEAVQGVFFRNWPAAPITATRGCPHVCTFCAGFTVTGRRVRARSARNFLEEVDLLHGRYGVRELKIVDDNFTFHRGFVEEVCRRLIERGPRITWNCPNGMRMDKLDEGLLALMRRAGCYEVTLGIESGSDRILEHMRKRLTTSDIRRHVAMIQRAGLPVSGLFIIGYPAETAQDIEKTIRFARELKLVRAEFNNFIPLPGTEAHEWLLRRGEAVDVRKLYFSNVPVPPEGMTVEEVKRLQRKAFLSFYLRPRTLLRQAADIRSLRQLRVIARRAISYIGSRGRAAEGG